MKAILEFVKKHDELCFAIALYVVIFGGLFVILSMPVPNDDTKQMPTYDPSERASFTPTCTIAPTDGICIEIIDGIPTATLNYTQETPTPTQTPEEFTPTATPEPTPAAQHVRIAWHLARIRAAEREKNPTPTPTPQEWRPVDITAGVPGTYAVEHGGHTWKPWANYHAITATDSPQYKLQRIAQTDENGLRYIIDADGVKRFCVAMPVAWCGGTSKDIGRLFDVVMSNGSVLNCILGDTKKVEHSQKGEGRFGRKGELMEFQVDEVRLHPGARRSGTISSIGGAFEGEADFVIVYDKNFLRDN